jgi:hypothetical protein
MVAVPDATPVTKPEAKTVAITVFVLLHMPPVTASPRDVAEPAQTVDAPLIVPATGN